MRQIQSWLKRLLGAGHMRPQIPEGVCVYAVGDIHGRYDLMTALLDRIWADADPQLRNVLVFLGDYVDRGPSSKEVLDLLVSLQKPGWEFIKLMGNHEATLLEFLKNPEIYPSWRPYGGAETLLSYGVRPPLFSDQKETLRAHQEFVEKFPREHFLLLSGLPYYFSLGGYFFVHAGIRPGVAITDQSLEDMIRIRDEFLLTNQVFEKVIVHGHTPTEKPVLRNNRIGIDTGAYATNILTAAKLYLDRVILLDTRGI